MRFILETADLKWHRQGIASSAKDIGCKRGSLDEAIVRRGHLIIRLFNYCLL